MTQALALVLGLWGRYLVGIAEFISPGQFDDHDEDRDTLATPIDIARSWK